MVLVKNLAILGEKETVTVDEKLFNGDINEFIEIILRKIIPGISDNKLKNMVGKFNLFSSNKLLNSGILELQLTEEEIREELNKDNVVLKLVFAPLSSSIKNSEGLPTVFAQGAVKSVKKEGGKKKSVKKKVGKKKSVKKKGGKKKGSKKKSVKKKGGKKKGSKKKSVKKKGGKKKGSKKKSVKKKGGKKGGKKKRKF